MVVFCLVLGCVSRLAAQTHYSFDHLFRAPARAVVQANFVAPNSGNPLPGPSPSPSPSPTPLPSRLFGKADAKLRLRWEILSCPTGKTILLGEGANPPVPLDPAHPYDGAVITPDATSSIWIWEGHLSVVDTPPSPAPSPGQPTPGGSPPAPTPTPTPPAPGGGTPAPGPTPMPTPTPAAFAGLKVTILDAAGAVTHESLRFALGDVWIMAGSPNLLVSDAAPHPGGTPPPFVVVSAAPGETPAASGGLSQPPLLAADFVQREASTHPVAVYVAARARTKVADWKTPSGSGAGAGGVVFGGNGQPVVSARGMIWWHGEWEAAHLDPVVDSVHDDFRDADYARTLARASDGLIPDLAQRCAGDARQDFVCLILQTPASHRHQTPVDRFPFGQPDLPGMAADAAQAWQAYRMPDSGWARIRAAEAVAVGDLRDQHFPAALVPGIASVKIPSLPQQWVWSAANKDAFGALAGQLADTADRALGTGPSPPSTGLAPAPSLVWNTSTNTAEISCAGRPIDPADAGTAVVEALFDDPQSIVWHTLPAPVANPQGGVTFTSPAGHKITRLRYAWGDDPGTLLTFRLHGDPDQQTYVLAPFVSDAAP